MRKMIAGRDRVTIIRMFAGGRKDSGMRRQIAEGIRHLKIRDIAEIRHRVDASKMFAGKIRVDAMRSKSTEVLLFLNSEHLTTPWAAGHTG